MRKHVPLLIFLLMSCCICKAQKPDPSYKKADNFVQEYLQFSRLGPGYSRIMSQEITGQFKALFERDAFVYWDLYKTRSDSLIPPLPLGEYIALAQKKYHFKQPILAYPSVKIRVDKDGKNAVACLQKINRVMDPDDNLLYSNKMNIRIAINLSGERPLIQNIFEDKRNSFVRSLSAGFNVGAWSSVFSSLASRSVVLAGSNEQFEKIAVTSGISFQAGTMMEMRFNSEDRYGLIFATGLFYSQMPLSYSMTGYSKSYHDTVGRETSNPLACTTFERSPEVKEKITVTKIEIPFLFKTYLDDWIYLKTGIALSYVSGTTRVNYQLSRTGGGTTTDLTTHEQYYLDEDHELDQSSYGYYRNKSFSFTKDKFLKKLILSFQLAAGFEKQVHSFSFGIEPNISFGMNPLSFRTQEGCYPLDNSQDFHSVLESTKMPAFEFAAGVRLLVGYVF